MKNLPTKSQILKNFSSCTSWEEKYIYIVDLGKFLPKFPKKMRTKEFLISGCQNYTWIALILSTSQSSSTQSSPSSDNSTINLYGDSDSSIVKGLITIIFSLYCKLTPKKIIDVNITPFFKQIQLQKNLTISRSQGIFAIIQSIRAQAHKIYEINKFKK